MALDGQDILEKCYMKEKYSETSSHDTVLSFLHYNTLPRTIGIDYNVRKDKTRDSI